MTADALIAEARSWLGTPFLHQGRRKGTGVDCVGLVLECARALGFVIEDRPAYDRRPHGLQLVRELEARVAALALQPVPPPAVQPGDVLLLAWRRLPAHLAVLARRGALPSLIHAYEPAGAVVEHRLDEEWRRRIVRGYRFPFPETA